MCTSLMSPKNQEDLEQYSAQNNDSSVIRAAIKQNMSKDKQQNELEIR